MTNTAGASKFFPKAQEGFTTTTSGLVASGASTVGLNSTGNYSNGDTIVLIIDPGVSGKEQSLTGVVDTSGVQLTGVVWLSGTNVPHVSGATVVDYVAAGHIDLISAGALVSHNPDGTPKAGVTYSTPILTTPTITDFTNADHTHASAAQGGQLGASALANGAVTAAKLLNGQIYRHQGDGTTTFASGGATTLDTSALDVKIQTGTGFSSGSNTDAVITFPVAYTNTPLIVATPYSSGGAFPTWYLVSQTKTGFTFRTGVNVISFCWIAIGI